MITGNWGSPRTTSVLALLSRTTAAGPAPPWAALMHLHPSKVSSLYVLQIIRTDTYRSQKGLSTLCLMDRLWSFWSKQKNRWGREPDLPWLSTKMAWTEESPHTVVVMMVIAQFKPGATLRPASLADSLDLGNLLCCRAGSGVQTGTWDNALNMPANLSFSRAVISSSATPDFIRWTAQVFSVSQASILY